jgi:hypothetical protein
VRSRLRRTAALLVATAAVSSVLPASPASLVTSAQSPSVSSAPSAPVAGGQPAAGKFIIDAPPSLAGEAARLARVDLDALAQVLGRAGLDIPSAVRVVLVAEDDALARSTPDWIVGRAFGSGEIVIFPRRVAGYPYDSLESVFRHEVVHVALAAQAGGRPLPRWFHEGVAVSIETGWSLTDDLRLLLAAASGPAIADLTRLFASDARPETTDAYLLATALVEDVRRRHGAALPGTVAVHVARGIPFPRAFELETGDTPDAAAASAWLAYRTLARWLPFLTSGSAVWTFILALSFLAFVVRLRQRARRRREGNDDEPEGWDSGAQEERLRGEIERQQPARESRKHG